MEQIQRDIGNLNADSQQFLAADRKGNNNVDNSQLDELKAQIKQMKEEISDLRSQNDQQTPGTASNAVARTSLAPPESVTSGAPTWLSGWGDQPPPEYYRSSMSSQPSTSQQSYPVVPPYS
jgi:TolA-binding protein